MTSEPKENIKQQLANLDTLSHSALRAEWQTRFSAAPTHHISRDLLCRAIAYQIQAQAYGGLQPAIVRRLRRLAEPEHTSRNRQPVASLALSPGTRLLREWQGETHVVEVLRDGFAWQGEQFRSLSAIARQITGTRWSGPRFFGTSRNTRPDSTVQQR